MEFSQIISAIGTGNEEAFDGITIPGSPEFVPDLERWASENQFDVTNCSDPSSFSVPMSTNHTQAYKDATDLEYWGDSTSISPYQCQQDSLGASIAYQSNPYAPHTFSTAIGNSSMVMDPLRACSLSSDGTLRSKSGFFGSTKNDNVIKRRKISVKRTHPATVISQLKVSLVSDPTRSKRFKETASWLLGKLQQALDEEQGSTESFGASSLAHHSKEAGDFNAHPASLWSINTYETVDSAYVGSTFSTHSGSLQNILTSSNSLSESQPTSSSMSQPHEREIGRSSISHSQYIRANTTYQCTSPFCHKDFRSKVDWKRHGETHWEQKRFLCLDCDVVTISTEGRISCVFCRNTIDDDQGVKFHILNCQDARRLGKTFPRKDKLGAHLRKEHQMENISADAESWHFPILSPWPRQCGFCGEVFDDWELRMAHIEIHFKQGSRISAWKLPFPRPKASREFHAGHEKRDGDDDDDDDDDDDFHHGGSPKISQFGHINFPGGQPFAQNSRQLPRISPYSHSEPLDLEIQDHQEPMDNAQPSVCSDNTYGHGEYQPLRRLGVGLHSTVVEVLHKSTMQLMVSKTSRPLAGSHTTTQFHRELNILKELQKLQHRHIIQLIDSWESDRQFTLLLSPAADGNLNQLMWGIESHRTSVTSLPWAWFGCLASAVSFLHDHKINHKDIKPSNILVRGYQVIICDFGIAHSYNGSVSTDTIFDHTPQYCAPEVAAGTGIGFPSDIFSLGCVFLEMITSILGWSLKQLVQWLDDDPNTKVYHRNLRSAIAWLDSMRGETQILKLSWIETHLDIIASMLQLSPLKRVKAQYLTAHIFWCNCFTHDRDWLCNESRDQDIAQVEASERRNNYSARQKDLGREIVPRTMSVQLRKFESCKTGLEGGGYGSHTKYHDLQSCNNPIEKESQNHNFPRLRRATEARSTVSQSHNTPKACTARGAATHISIITWPRTIGLEYTSGDIEKPEISVNAGTNLPSCPILKGVGD